MNMNRNIVRVIIKECDECGGAYRQRKGNQRYCDDCRPVVRRRQKRYEARVRRAQPDPEEIPVTDWSPLVTNDPWKNLMCAILIQAKIDGDEQWLDENRELYSAAITGKEMSVQYGMKGDKIG